VGVVAEIFGHRRPLFPEMKSQSVVEVVVWGYAVGDGLGLGEEDIS